jgi:hypothetical protein
LLLLAAFSVAGYFNGGSCVTAMAAAEQLARWNTCCLFPQMFSAAATAYLAKLTCLGVSFLVLPGQQQLQVSWLLLFFVINMLFTSW